MRRQGCFSEVGAIIYRRSQGSGTPKGTDPMKPGNGVEAHIGGIGTLGNTVEAFR